MEWDITIHSDNKYIEIVTSGMADKDGSLEMANWNAQINSYEKQAEQMRQMVALCENRDDVFRYAWFIGRGAEDRFTNLFNSSSGDLNALGKLYISLPY